MPCGSSTRSCKPLQRNAVPGGMDLDISRADRCRVPVVSAIFVVRPHHPPRPANSDRSKRVTALCTCPTAGLHASRGARRDGDRCDRHHDGGAVDRAWTDRKSTRLNSSHVRISYAVFCLKKKNKKVLLNQSNTRS